MRGCRTDWQFRICMATLYHLYNRGAEGLCGRNLQGLDDAVTSSSRSRRSGPAPLFWLRTGGIGEIAAATQGWKTSDLKQSLPATNAMRATREASITLAIVTQRIASERSVTATEALASPRANRQGFG